MFYIYSRVLKGDSQTFNPECQNTTTELLLPGFIAEVWSLALGFG